MRSSYLHGSGLNWNRITPEDTSAWIHVSAYRTTPGGKKLPDSQGQSINQLKGRPIDAQQR